MEKLGGRIVIHMVGPQVFTKHRSSTSFAVYGNKSLTQAPLSPYCLNGRMGFTSGNDDCAALMRGKPCF